PYARRRAGCRHTHRTMGAGIPGGGVRWVCLVSKTGKRLIAHSAKPPDSWGRSQAMVFAVR
ncbi:hypothetical protein, partial [Prosthecobacter sp.]|uniref:hypothetical protein n=1 Tax=Prosthecobacter sp. TaxID=1965333 RepID=UPI00248968E2